MAVKKVIEIVAETKGALRQIKELYKNLLEKQKEADIKQDSLNEKFEGAGDASEKASKKIGTGVKKTSVLITQLDKYTGGLASSFVDVANAATKGGTAMKTALITSGIGAFVVVLGWVVTHWEDIKDLIDSSNKDLQKRIDLNERNLEALDMELTLLEDQEAIVKLRKGSTKEIREKQKDILRLLAEENIILLENLEVQLKKEKAQNREITFWERLKIMAIGALTPLEKDAAIREATNAESERTLEIEKQINEAKRRRYSIEQNLLEIDKKNNDDDEKLSDEERKAREKANREEARRLLALQKELEAEQRRLDAIDKIREDHENKKKDLEAKTLEEKLELDKQRALEDLELQEGTLVEKFDARLAILSYYFDKEQELRDQRRTEKEEQDAKDAKKAADDRRKELQEEQALADAKTYMQLQLASNIGNALNNISQLFDQSTAMSKAAAIADIAIGTGIGFINALDIAQKSSKAAGPAAAFAFPVFYASQVAAVLGAAAQAKRILSTAKTKGGGGGVGATPTAPPEPPRPSFNLVGNSQANQLAGAINTQDQPIRAYVVSRNMSSQQEMDRNIRATASVG